MIIITFLNRAILKGKKLLLGEVVLIHIPEKHSFLLECSPFKKGGELAVWSTIFTLSN